MAQVDNACDRSDKVDSKRSENDHETKSETKKENVRVRFIDDEEIKGHFKDVDEVDHAVPKVKKVHILKNRSSSEQSALFRSNSFKARVFGHKTASLESLNKKCDNLNNNNPKNQNFNDTEKPKDDNATGEEKSEATNGSYKKNANVYSVFQAKTLSERRKSLPNLSKSLAAKANDRYHRSHSDPKEDALMPIKELKTKAMKRLSKGIGRLLRRSSSINISEPDPVYKVAYLGNVLTGWAKGEGCVDKPLATLWRNYNQTTKPDVVMKLSIANSGLKGFTKEHGLTEYWSHRITYCASPPHYPKIFCWVYRHEGRKLKHELRCHAVLCSKEAISQKITEELQLKLQQALNEFKRDKISRQNARLSLANAVYDNPSMPRRKILLSVGGNNYRPPLERSKSAPKLMAIEELCSEEDEEEEHDIKENNLCNTWTKSKSSQRTLFNVDELYPSYTLGRRRSDRIKSPRKISLPEKFSNLEIEPMEKSNSLEDPPLSKLDDSDNQINGSLDNMSSNETMSFSEEVLSIILAESKRLSIDYRTSSQDVNTDAESRTNDGGDLVKEEDNVDSDRYLKIKLNSKHSQHQESSNDLNEDTKDIPVKTSASLLEHLCSQSNYLVLDSDEGSISSGCETASTVTSSDIEITSLPCQFVQNDFKKKTRANNDHTNDENVKVSVLQRVQSFEQLSSKRDKSFIPRQYSSFKAVSCSNRLKPKIEHSNDDTTSIESTSPCGDVSLIPIGERISYSDHCFKRRLTYPPVKVLVELTDPRVQKSESTTIGPYEKYSDDSDNVAMCDNDSACSDESGYSELLESGYLRDGMVGNTVMV